jgi:hypothetical protein
VYSFTIYTSARLLQKDETSEINYQITPYSSFSCLFLLLKLVSLFKITLFYGRYYTIAIKIAKKLWFFFIYILVMILFSFAIAFYILLSPNSSYSLDKRIINDDPNNPWSLTPTYQVFENETTDVSNNNLFILQKPDENTNMFANFTTSFLATSLLLAGIFHIYIYIFSKKFILTANNFYTFFKI